MKSKQIVNYNPEKALPHEMPNPYLTSAAWQSVLKARMKGRPTSIEYIEEICDCFIEFHGDRGLKDDEAIVGGIGLIAGEAFTIIGHQKGRDLHENVRRNFGMPHPEGYRKALRLMKQAEKFNRPILCFIDTPGAFCGLGAEERGQGEAIARNLIEMAGIGVPIISVVIGEGGSGGALALGIANKVFMLENTIYSVLSPEGFASILWKDSTRAAEAAELMKITAVDLMSFGIIDHIIEEQGDSHFDLKQTCLALKNEIINQIDSLKALTPVQLIENRAQKYRTIGI